MDRDTRNLLANTTQALRRGLEEEFALQLEGRFDVFRDGSIAGGPGPQLDDAEKFTRHKIVEAIQHRRAAGESDRESVDAFLREAAFTFLNRLAALKMMEARGIVQECVTACDTQGFNARGFKEFGGLAPGLTELPDGGYRLYLECLFDEIGREVGILFDRTDPASLLWPRRAALLDALGRINDPKLAGIWSEDETIGWIYQYYNDPEERRKMRDVKQGGSAAPRNSREMAVRNQFFTPRYVVEFLTDNALGRLWYEMTKGKTSLKDRCRFLIKRSDEVFLNQPDSPEVEAAQQWLQTGQGELPGLFSLAHTVDGYHRFAGNTDAANAWLDETLSRIRSGASDDLSTAEFLETLFLACRRERFCEGFLEVNTREIDFILATVAQRVAKTRQSDLTKEELLRQPVFIPHRPLKDPRQIRMIDPACGSMHFGLYAFDLFLAIYEEAWDLHAAGGSTSSTDHRSLITDHSLLPLPDRYASKEDLMREVPGLILEHNIHGVDIDPRAAQIAGLALWLRAQRAWQEQGLRPADRPTITRSNIVCAEPMPGEEDLLQQFVVRSFSPTERPFFSRLLGEIFKTMRLAGEAGSLLKIEDEVSALVADARAQWKKIGKHEGEFFSNAEILNLDRRTLLEKPIDTGSWSLSALSGIPDLQFWEKAEERIYRALRDFAESAGADGYQRRLFADDAARGFAFIDLCRQRYDVALMNPPFGDASLPSKPYLDETYGDTKGDVYKAFVECFQARLVPAGFLGIISSRTGFFLGQSEDWRTRVVLRLFRPIALADLGGGVLDAMVEVAAYVLRNLSESETRDLTHSIVPVLEKVTLDKQERFSLPKWQAARGGLKRHQAVAELEHLEAEGFVTRDSGDIVRYLPNWKSAKKVSTPQEPVYPALVCVRALDEPDKGDALLASLNNNRDRRLFISEPGAFAALPAHTFAYWVPTSVLNLCEELPRFDGGKRTARRGPSSGDDSRRVRTWWEVGVAKIGPTGEWVRFSKGGTFSPFYADVHLLVSWESRRSTFHGFLGRPGRMIEKLESIDCFFRPGITWPLRTQIGLGPRLMPAGCAFGHKGPSAFCDDDDPHEILALAALMSSAPFRGLVSLQMAFGSYEVGVIQKTVVPANMESTHVLMAAHSRSAWKNKRSVDAANTTSHAFLIPALLTVNESSIDERAAAWTAHVEKSDEAVSAIQTEIDDIAFRLYGLDGGASVALTANLASVSNRDDDAADDEDDEEEIGSADSPSLTADLLDYALGAAFGRWDLRFATGEKPAPPEPDPFDPLPVCPPGMLQNADGLPATPADVPADYPLRISWPGILVDDKGHDEDIETRVREVLTVVFPDRADEIAHEACEILGVKTLREFFRKPAAFFAGHLKRHSKSRRQAPIYWPLSSPNGRYSLWLYYPRLTADTLFTALRDFLEPKLQYEEGRAFRIRQDAGSAPAPSQRAEIAEADELVDDLRALRDELKHVAPLFKPDLNDGVILNHAPLWRMIGLPKWRKDCQATWEKLAAGDYDWAHLALHLWPERVIPQCATDRSLAIAHGLEDFFWEEIPADELPTSTRGRSAKKAAKKKSKAAPADEPAENSEIDDETPAEGTGKWRARKVSAEQVQHLIATRSSPAVKDALAALASAPTAGGAKKKAKKGLDGTIKQRS